MAERLNICVKLKDTIINDCAFDMSIFLTTIKHSFIISIDHVIESSQE